MTVFAQSSGGRQALPERSAIVFRPAVEALAEAGLPFLVGGGYAFRWYTGVERQTNDFDIFCRPSDVKRILDRLSAVGYRTEIKASHWLGKAYVGDVYVDVVFSSGNGVAAVDDDWFKFAVDGDVLGLQLPLCPAEEMIWSKAYVLERERCDIADVAHLIHARAELMDWDRLIARFGDHWRLLLSHLVLFGFVYPSERARVPQAVMDLLLARLAGEQVQPPPEERVCQGPLLSRFQYIFDTHTMGYRDARPLAAQAEDELLGIARSPAPPAEAHGEERSEPRGGR